MRKLIGVVVADHVIAEDDESMPGKVDASCRNGNAVRIFEPAVSPVAVGADDGWKRSGFATWAIEVASQIETRIRFEQDLLHRVIARVIAAIEATENVGVDRHLLRHGQ